MFEKMIDRYTALSKKGKVVLWVAVVIGVFIVIPTGGDTNVTVVVAAETTTTTVPATTTTGAPTTTVAPTTTTTVASTTTTTAAPVTTTTEVQFSSKELWNMAAIRVLSDEDVFAGFTDEGIIDSIELVCTGVGDSGNGAAFILAIVADGDLMFLEQVVLMLGVLQVPPACANPADQVHVDEAFDLIASF